MTTHRPPPPAAATGPSPRWLELELEALRPELLGYLRARAPQGDAEDLLQLTLLRAWERGDTLQDPSKVRGWLYQIAKNALIDAGRRRRREVPLEPASLDLQPAATEAPAAASCCCAAPLVGSLPPGQAQVLRAVDLEERPLAEAAARQQSTVNAVTVKLHRARKNLRARLEEWCGVRDVTQALQCTCGTATCGSPAPGLAPPPETKAASATE